MMHQIEKKDMQQNPNTKVNDFSAHLGGKMLTRFSILMLVGQLVEKTGQDDVRNKLRKHFFVDDLLCGLASRSSKQLRSVITVRKTLIRNTWTTRATPETQQPRVSSLCKLQDGTQLITPCFFWLWSCLMDRRLAKLGPQIPVRSVL